MAGGAMIPAAEVHQLLLSFCNGTWQKVARIIGKTYGVLQTRGSMFTGMAEHVDARRAVLVGSGQLEVKGDIKRCGYSDVRLPGGSGEDAK